MEVIVEGCNDTAGWTNGWTGCAYEDGGRDPGLCAPTPGASWPSTAGWTCKAYKEKGWCSDGGEPKAFALGTKFNAPEENCCACHPGTHAVVVCSAFECQTGVLKENAADLVCLRRPCEATCCLATCHSSSCEGYSPDLLIPLIVLVTSAFVCVLRQVVRCKSERLGRDRAFRLIYFSLMFVWDVCDQTASWWFWQYTRGVGASLAVQSMCLASALLGASVIVLAFIAGLTFNTGCLVDSRVPEFAYSIGAGLSDIIMLVAVFVFETEGLDAASWIKVLNLVATIIDFVMKVMQAAWTLCGPEAEPLKSPLYRGVPNRG